MKFVRQARKEQSQLEHSQLVREVKVWLERRELRDRKYQYRTQLEAIGTILTAALLQLETALAVLDLNQPEETIYAECRLFDLRTVWLRRVWEFFKEKFGLSASLAFLYVGLVMALQFVLRGLFSHTTDVTLVASTLAIAVLFQPLRRRIQDGIDRRFYRRKSPPTSWRPLVCVSAHVRISSWPP